MGKKVGSFDVSHPLNCLLRLYCPGSRCVKVHVTIRFPLPSCSGSRHWQKAFSRQRFRVACETRFNAFISSCRKFCFYSLPCPTQNILEAEKLALFLFWNHFSNLLGFQKPMSGQFSKGPSQTMWTRQIDCSHGVVCILPYIKLHSTGTHTKIITVNTLGWRLLSRNSFLK